MYSAIAASSLTAALSQAKSKGSPDSDHFSRSQPTVAPQQQLGLFYPGIWNTPASGGSIKMSKISILVSLLGVRVRMPMTRLGIVFLALAGLSSGGCFIPYMMIRGTTEQLQLASNPQGATASVSSGSSCQTPCDLEMPRSSSVIVTFTKPGCKQQLVSIFPTISGGGMLWGGVFGEMSGADYDLQPNPAVANLDCPEQTPMAAVSAPAPMRAPAAQRINDATSDQWKSSDHPQ
jgi:hypothetical protein